MSPPPPPPSSPAFSGTLRGLRVFSYKTTRALSRGRSLVVGKKWICDGHGASTEKYEYEGVGKGGEIGIRVTRRADLLEERRLETIAG